ncbi:MAG: sigma-70 family RNA polymerase sigma factor [Planctomycetes bacterium]|nr:sigma-70 family RNA polymerase sigma factor [Planctomycetota bacterium]
MDDRAIVARCLAGDGAAWRLLHEQLEALCREIVRSALRRGAVLSGEVDVDEVTQDFFEHLAESGGRRLGLYRSDAPLRHYVAVLASNFARARADEIRRRRVREQSIDSVSEPVSRARPAEEVLEHAESRARLDAAVDALAPADRLLFDLLFRDGVEVEAACRILRISANALYVRKNRLKERLRDSLDPSRRAARARA